MSFDRVADVYDATRALPEGVPGAITRRIEEATYAGPETRFLELGVGTGRIAEPLIAAGYPYTGVTSPRTCWPGYAPRPVMRRT